MSKKIILALLTLSFLIQTSWSKDVYLTMDKDALSFTTQKFGERVELKGETDDLIMVKIDEDALAYLSYFMHQEFNRCGGFVFHESESDAIATLEGESKRNQAAKSFFSLYAINNESLVHQALAEVSALNIQSMIEKLSDYNNRYYQSDTGVEAANWIADQWRELSSHRNDVSVELVDHRSWAQPSVVMTIKGQSDEVIVVGGHIDSIAGFWGGSRARAPGADDNASGIATITETIRILMGINYRPQKTIKFMGYAAEEVGLRGSKEIAGTHRNQDARVVGVLQLDMTNYKGTKDLDIVLMTDYTNEEQNAFIGALIDTYLPDVFWGYDRCGYACSDHASWHNEGYPASMPFESRMRDSNKNIHSSRDTLEKTRGDATHAEKFARMALAYILELD